MRETGKELIRAALLLAALVIAGRSIYAQANPAPSGKTLDKVVLQLTWYHEFQFAGYYAAQLKGFFAEEGLEVEIRDRTSNQLPVDAVLAGEADFGNATSDIVLLHMQGKPVVVLACIMQHSPWVVLVRADSGITTLDDLLGKTVSMDMSYRDVEILAMFRDEHISTEKMTIVKKGPGVENLINGTVDARASYLSDQPFALREKGFEPRVIRPINYGIDFYGDTLFTSERQIREHPERVAAFRRASLRGWQYAMEHPEELIDYILSAYYADPRPDAVSYSREHLRFEATVMAEDLMHPVLVEIGHMNPLRWRRIADTYAAMGMAEPISSFEDFIYDPNPEPDYRWFYVAMGLLMGVAFVGALARIWNKRLHKAVAQRTRELQESNNKHERLVDNLSDTFLYRHGVKGVFNYVSSSITQVLGYSTEEFLTHFSEYLTDHPVNQEVIKHTEQSINGVQQQPYEVQIYHKDGNARWLQISEAPVRDRNGKVVAVEGVAHDITERKRSEEALWASEDKYRTLVSHTPAVLWTSDQYGHTPFISSNVEQAYGYTSEEILKAGDRLWFERIHPDDVERVKKAFEAVFKESVPLDVEYRIRRKDGEWIWLSDRSYGAYEKDGVRYADGVFFDITDRKKAREALMATNMQLEASEQQLRASNQQLRAAEEELREKEAKWRLLIENAPNFIMTVERNGKIQFINRTAPGTTPDQTVGTNIYDYIVAEYHSVARQTIEQVFVTRLSGSFEAKLEVRGEHVWFDSQVGALERDGEVFAVMIIASDITERKQTEEAIKGVISQSAAQLGQEFFDALAKQLCEVLGADYSLVGECTDENLTTVRTISVFGGGRIQPNFEYDLAGTPCENVVGKTVCSHSSGVSDQFPSDVLLKDMGIEGYVGVPLLGSQNEPLGIMVALFRHSVANTAFAESILQLFAARTVGEIIRMRAEHALEDRLRFETLLAELSAKFVNLPADEVNNEIEQGLRHIVEVLGVDRSSLAEFSEDKSELHTTNSCAVAGIRPFPTTNISDLFPWFAEKLRRGEIVRLSEVDELPEEAERENLWATEEGLQGILAVPLTVGGSIIAALSVDSLKFDRRWSDETVSRVRLIGEVLANALMRRHTEEEIRSANQQLQAANQQLQAANQQLIAGEKELRQSEERYRRIVEDQTELICRNLPDGTITFVNEAYCRYFDRSRDELVGQRFMPLIPEEDHSKVEQYFASLGGDNPVGTHEHRVILSDGEIRWHQWTNRAILDDVGNIVEFQGAGRDITKQKKAEQEIQEHQERLRSLASELSLAEERQRHRIATELHDNTSQDLAFTLTKLQNIREAADRDSREPLSEVCEVMSKVVENIRNMTFDICSPTLYRFGLEAAVSELLEDKLAMHDDINYDFHDDNKAKPLSQDIKVALFQSVRELINNTIKHARANKVAIDIQRCQDTIKITVSDDGGGFKVEELESPERSRGGFGLFSIAERLKYIGGSFAFQSQPGRGSSFTLEAPLNVDADLCKGEHDGGEDLNC